MVVLRVYIVDKSSFVCFEGMCRCVLMVTKSSFVEFDMTKSSLVAGSCFSIWLYHRFDNDKVVFCSAFWLSWSLFC